MYYDMSASYFGRNPEPIGKTLKEAKAYMDNVDCHCAAIQNGGIVQTICDGNGNKICQRDHNVVGIGYSRTIEISDWYDVE